MDRISLYLGLSLVLSSVSIPFSVNSYDVKAEQCRSLDEAIYAIDEPDLSVMQRGLAEWLRCFGELGLHESKYRPVRDTVVDLQREISKFERTGYAMSELAREHELRRIEERVREIPAVGEELVATTYAIFPYVFKRFLAALLVVLVLIAPSFVMNRLIASSEREMRYRV